LRAIAARSFKTCAARSRFPGVHQHSTWRQGTTTEQIVAFLLFAVVAAVTPGPSNIMLTAAGANAGVLRGLPCLFGVSAGMGLMMFLVPLGVGGLVLRTPLVLRVLHWGGAAFLLWLAWKIATAGRSDSAAERDPVGFVGAALFQWINPKSWLVSASAAGTFLDPASGSAITQALALGGLFVLAALPSGLVWLVFGAAVQQALREERRRRIFNVVMGLLLALSVVLILR
jgi:threonine/homoserine/homoserine lactone efflux protein